MPNKRMRVFHGESEGFDTHFLGEEPLIIFLSKIIRQAVRALAILMTLVIVWGVFDVLLVLYQKIKEPPFYLLNLNDILDTFAAFLAVLIAIEIFLNIILYLQDEVIHVRLVLATALMAAARKVIIFDYSKVSSEYIWGTGAVIIALSVSFWLAENLLECSSHPNDTDCVVPPRPPLFRPSKSKTQKKEKPQADE
ncbi:phosphate-starvation-inducible PsiE family protein [Desulfobaculum bizertense]|uniref:Uncharacterized membrane protein, DUF373 family n=1 Tax=Desulfobaculum bizertense DSM 18034 TaxID=1121442 RepID=A0A1T4WPH6_9BACT|nr:phosphate-starvation-inducible PsiE family protein [Desulfobaculum bizertense]UIJ39343.1 phosphate-starvation-inducible PsiE family protein [Desulfobaculum bizertense]SKA78768.1 Uncharacterized membrane protein, DUF373 family [Desulfobaculum bizertense DSM 18034]